MKAKPFVKWAGGKAQILAEIRLRYPAGLGVSVTKYAEPFVGGGAVLFDVLANYAPAEVYISDVNRELIHTYTMIRDKVDKLLDALREVEAEYLQADEGSRKEIYYRSRERFNTLKAERSDSAELAALFIFINRTCFNGLYRVNRRGEFNVPQGSYKNPAICDEKNLRAVSSKLRGVKIICGDYKLSREFIDENTFVYFDPPYRPLTATANFTAYSDGSFGDEQQIELARFIDEMSERGAWIVASNSDPKNADESDEFFDKLYERHSIARIEASRIVNSKNGWRSLRTWLISTKGE